MSCLPLEAEAMLCTGCLDHKSLKWSWDGTLLYCIWHLEPSTVPLSSFLVYVCLVSQNGARPCGRRLRLDCIRHKTQWRLFNSQQRSTETEEAVSFTTCCFFYLFNRGKNSPSIACSAWLYGDVIVLLMPLVLALLLVWLCSTTLNILNPMSAIDTEILLLCTICKIVMTLCEP